MKLNTKFSIIVAFTIFQIALLTSVSLYSNKKVVQMKSYQAKQQEVASQVSDLIAFLNEMDYSGFNSSSAYREWVSKVDKLDDGFQYLIHDPATKSFPDSLKENIESIETIWEMLKGRFEPVEESLQLMQDVKLGVSETQQVSSKGIRDAYEKYPETEQYELLYEYLLTAHGSLEGINRSKNSLSKLNMQSSVEFTSIVEKQVVFLRLLTIIIAVVSSVFMAVLIFTVTTGISKRIVSIENLSSVLAKKDFSTSIKPNGSTEMISLMTNINNMVDQINEFFVVVKTTATKAISSGYTINDSANSAVAATGQIEENLNTIGTEFEAITGAVQRAITVISEMNNHIETLVDNNKKQTKAIENSNSSVNEVVETLEYMNVMASKRTQSALEMNKLVADGDSKIETTKNVLNDINNKLDEVREVVTIINGVANKTNLLSMNAAIESAHAGEAGKGFGVVAAEIRSLAEATSKNAVRIADVVQNIINSVSQANDASKAASIAFDKVSNQAQEIVTSLQEITAGIGRIDNQMHSIKEQSQETSEAADLINSYCGELSSKQLLVSKEVDSMNDLFVDTTISIRKMKQGTSDIVNRMKAVGDSSKESYKNMTDLENILEEFKTKSEVDEAVEQADTENTIENAVSEELKNFEQADLEAIQSHEEVTFDLDNVEEYQG